MRIQHNIMAMSAYRNYTNNVSAMKKNLEKLSSGYKINRAGDDAAGLAISEKMRAQITGLETAQKNAKDGISLVQTAEGALTEVHDMLNRMVTLATQSANGTYDNTTDRAQMQKELDQLRSEIDRIADSSNFNGIKLLDGSMSADEINTKAFEITTATSTEDVAQSGIVGNPPTEAQGTILHKSGASAVVGGFTLALDQLSVGKAATGQTASINISIGNGTGQTVTVKQTATDKTTAMSGVTIAAKLAAGDGKYVVVSSAGAVKFASTSTAGGNNSLVYKATANGDGTVTYTLDGYVNDAGAYQAGTLDTKAELEAISASVSAKLEGAAGASLNFTVGASATAANTGALTDNRQNKGSVNATDTTLKGESTLGNMILTFDTSKLENDMTITLGTGTQKGGVKIKVDSNATGTSYDVDLSDLTDIAGADKAEAMNRIAKALNGGNGGGGTYIGVDAAGGHFTLSEKTNGAGTTAANSTTYTAMGSVASFGKLLQVTKQAEVTKPTIEIDGAQVKEGDSLIVDGTKYVFTNNSMADSSTVKYVKMPSTMSGTNVAAALAAKIGNGATPSGNVVTLSGTSTIGTNNKNLVLQIGDTADSFNQLSVSIKDMHVAAMGAGEKSDGTMDYTTINDISIASQSAAQAAVDVIKRAINYVSDMRGTLGATQNRLDHTINNLSVMTENIQDAESTIRDVDVAEEMMAYTKNNILIQSAQAMLAQANQVPQGVLQLLQ